KWFGTDEHEFIHVDCNRQPNGNIESISVKGFEGTILKHLKGKPSNIRESDVMHHYDSLLQRHEIDLTGTVSITSYDPMGKPSVFEKKNSSSKTISKKQFFYDNAGN